MNATLALLPIAAALACAAVILTLLRHPEWLPLDRPNERSLHDRPVPRVGGLGMMAGVLLGFALLRAEPLLAALVLVLAVVSFLDDRSHLPIGVRFATHAAADTPAASAAKTPSPASHAPSAYAAKPNSVMPPARPSEPSMKL